MGGAFRKDQAGQGEQASDWRVSDFWGLVAGLSLGVWT